jgi:Fe2+ transport system protein FeoA
MLKTETPVPIQQLAAGQPACVACLNGAPNDVARLAEMGIQRGTNLCVVRGGKTCILQIDGCRMCVRASDEMEILVTPS